MSNVVKKDYQSINNEILEEYNDLHGRNSLKHLCYAPFSSLRFAQSGQILGCCFNRGYTLGKYPESSIHDAWFGEEIIKLREHISNNKLDLGCDICDNRIKKKLYNLSGAFHFDYLSKYDSGIYPSMLDFEISNTCNLECVMCLGENSSSIRTNREKLPPYHQNYDQNFVEQLKEFIPYLKEARFSGGEPFLIPIYYDVWKIILDLNPKVKISVLTNATILNDNIKALLKKGDFIISVSIDSFVKETYQKIRINGNFDIVKKNIEYFLKYSKKIGNMFSINLCPLPYNWQEIPSILRYCNKNDIQLVLHTIIFPPSQSLWTLDSEELIHIHEYFKGQIFHSKTELHKKNIMSFQHFVLQVSGWIKAAEDRKNQKMRLFDYTTGELFEELKMHLQNPSNDSFVVISNILEESELNESEIKNIIMNLLSFPSDIIISELNHNDTDKILIRLKMFKY